MSTKISQLPVATSPVAPDAVLPVVQAGQTRQASINQLGFLPAGTGAVTRTIQNKLREIPSILDFATQADVEASGLNWFFMPSGESLDVSGQLTKNFWGTGKVALSTGEVPGTQGAANYGFLALESVSPGTGQYFAFASKVFTGTRTDQSSAPGQNHGVAIYGEAQRGAGSSDAIWALNTVTEAFNLNGATIGYEIDVNNKSGIDPGLNPAQSFHALSLISGAAGRGGTAIVIDRNGDFTGNEWNRGLHVKEVLLRGIEFTNCGNASGFWTDSVLTVKGTSAAFDPLMKFIPYDDTDQSAYIWYAANAADTLVRGGLLKRGELTINEPNGKGAAGLSIKGIANGDDIVFLQRNTDTSPTGTFLRAVNAANTSVFFDIDQNTTASETNIRLSVAGAAAVRVSVGAADSGGTGFRTLRVPN